VKYTIFFGKKNLKLIYISWMKNYQLKNGDEIMEFYAIDAEGNCLARQSFEKNPAPTTNYTHQICFVYDDLQNYL
jgi:hypothetical protein